MFYKWEIAFISHNICLVIAQADVSYHAGPYTMMDLTPDLSRFTHLLVKSCTRISICYDTDRMIYSALQNNCNSNWWS